MNIDVTNKEVIEFLISKGWTPPWNYNMEEAPKDGTLLLLKNKPCFEGAESYTCQGSWRGDTMSRLRYIELLLEELYDEHVDSFTYMMEQPYTFHYFCEMYHPQLYNMYVSLLKETNNEK